MTEKEVRDIVRELILEIEENELSWYGVRWNNGFNTYKVRAKNPRHASEKIEALHGVKIDFHNFQKLPNINSKKQLKIKSVEKEKQDRIDAIAKEKRDRDEKIRKDLEEKSDYIAYFKFPLSVALESFLQLDIRKALNEKYFRITPVPLCSWAPSHVGGVPVKIFSYYIQIPKMYFIPEVLEKLLNPKMEEKLRKEARDRVRMICDNAEWVLIDFEELNPKTINVYFQNYKELKGGPLRLKEMTNDPDEDNPFNKEKREDDLEDKLGKVNDPDPVDQDIEGLPYSSDDIWPGSDIEGIKKGGTGVPYGMGYPNWRRGGKLTRKELREILHINYVEGVSEQDEIKQNKISQQSTYNFIKKEMPWVFQFKYKLETPEWDYEKNTYNPDMWRDAFSEYFGNREWSGSWPRDFSEAVNRNLQGFQYWMNFNKLELKGAAKYNRHWIKRFKNAREEAKIYPRLEQDFSRLVDYLNKLRDYEPTNPRNPSVYPLYVSLYDTTRNLGGHEEGGWWYDKEDLVHSIPVRNYQEMRKAAVVLLKLSNEADLNGKPTVVLEKESDGRGNKPPPSYS